MKSIKLTDLLAEANEQHTSTLTWKDGFSVKLNSSGSPIGYRYLGTLNSGIDLPDTDDWREFETRGFIHKSLSPKFKVWYDVDSS